MGRFLMPYFIFYLQKGGALMADDSFMGFNKWSIETYVIHNEAMRVSEASHNKAMQEVEVKLQDVKIQHLEEIIALNDRRYTEGNELRAMALKIKETADANALELASESQTYKEARNDATREQNLKETGIYATRDDLAAVVEIFKKALKPIEEFVSTQQGATKGSQITMGKIYAAIGATGTIIGIIIGLSVFLTR
jgi:hypothetical protein